MANIKSRTTAKGERRYDVKFRTPADEDRTRTFRTRREAEAFARSIEVDKSRGMFVDPSLSATTFDKWSNNWLNENPAKRSSSRARDEVILRLHLLPALGNRSLGSITPRDVQALVSDWSKRYKPRTTWRHYETLRAILNAAVAGDLLGRSPCRGIKLPERSPRDVAQLSADDLRVIADELGEHWAPMLWLGALCGLRWGEVAGLRVGRLDFFRSTVSIAEQLTRGEGGRTVIGPPKSHAGRRTLSVPHPLMELLADHLERAGLTGAEPDAFVFTMPGGAPLDYSRWRRRVWLRAVVRAGLAGVTFHDLRRANATAMVAEGIDLKTAQRRFGHSDVRLTIGLYAQAVDSADRDAAERLGTRLMGDRNQNETRSRRGARGSDRSRR